MDASALLLNPKRQKLDGGEELDGGSKSLSNLPDVIILKILSLLPTKDAIRTSILSKRWEHQWTSIPYLEFYEGPLTNRSLLVNAVDRALLLRGPADIEVFGLAFAVLGDSYRVNAWISAIVRRNVEELSISLDSVHEPVLLPDSLFTSATLVVLDLDMPCVFKVPRTICFSSLKSLSLKSVVFSDDYLTQKLFSGFPVLEDLSLTDCNWMNIKFVSIFAPKLRILTITEGGVEISRASESSDGCQMMVFGDNLKYFDYVGEFLNECCFYNSSSLKKAEIHVCEYLFKRLRRTAYRFYKLLRGLSSVKHLTICNHTFEVRLLLFY